MNRIRIILLTVGCIASMVASAQWQWVDKDGRKVFSDRAPPAEVLDKNILKRPGGLAVSTTAGKLSADGEASVSAAPQASSSAPRPSGIDKELTEKKKKTDEAELAKRKAEEEKNLKAQVDNCARAKNAKASLESGRRMSHPNEKGEPVIMDAATRSAEINRIQSIVDSDCK